MKQKNEDTIRVTAYLPRSLHKACSQLATAQALTVAMWVRRVIAEHVKGGGK